MSVKKVAAWRCPTCQRLYTTEGEAVACAAIHQHLFEACAELNAAIQGMIYLGYDARGIRLHPGEDGQGQNRRMVLCAGLQSWEPDEEPAR